MVRLAFDVGTADIGDLVIADRLILRSYVTKAGTKMPYQEALFDVELEVRVLGRMLVHGYNVQSLPIVS